LFKLFSAYLTLALIFGFLISGRVAEVYGQTSGSYSDYTEEGTASWYGPGFHGRKTANGERFNTNDLTCAHKSLPFNTLLKVTNLENGRYTIVRVNDRGPYAHGRIIDLSSAAKTEIGMGGLAKVRIETYKPVNSADITEEEDAMPLNLFEDAITRTSKIFVELNDRKLNSNIIKNNSQDEFRRLLSTFKKVKILVNKDNSILENIAAPENSIDMSNFVELTDKIRTFTGYSIEVQSFDTEEAANKLIGKLEALNYKDVILVEIVSSDSINFKVFLGYYDSVKDADADLRDIKEMNYDCKVIKILS